MRNGVQFSGVSDGEGGLPPDRDPLPSGQASKLGMKRVTDKTHSGRIEDGRLLRGQGRYVADRVPANALHGVFMRAEQAPARIVRLGVDVAQSMPGVVMVLTGADLAAAGVGPFDSDPMPVGEGEAVVDLPMPLMAIGVARHVGEPLALVVATSRAEALDAAEAVEVDVLPEPADTSLAASATVGDLDGARSALARSAHVIHHAVTLPRMVAAPLECRGCLAIPGPDGSLTFHTSSQNPYVIRRSLADQFGWDVDAIQVLSPDVGGSFGLKGFLTREEAVVAWAAGQLGQPVSWGATRSEAMVADHQARGVTGHLSLGLDRDLKFTSVVAAFDVDLGAYPHRRGFGILNNAAGITGMYRMPHAAATVRGHLSPRMPLAPYRGNGRPEATLAIEQLIDVAARQLGADPVALRRANLLRPDDLPHKTAMGFPIDVGDFERGFDQLVALADHRNLPDRKAAAEARGRLHGFGLITCLESSGGPVSKPRPDHCRLTVQTNGRLMIAPGVTSSGQGHETAFARMAADRLGLGLDEVDYVNGDTSAVLDGRGSGGSSGMVVAGSAVSLALDQLVQVGKEIAALQFGCDVDGVLVADGLFREVGGNRALSLSDLAAQRGPEAWVINQRFVPDAAVFPNGVHACEVEIDPETGALQITRYSVVEDIGIVHNPDFVAGQLHGGIAMGLAEALGEQVHYDAEGQVLTGTLMDYYLARAADIPMFQHGNVEVATARNPLGVKGVGEAGTVGGVAALMAAVSDALATRGVAAFDLPATPQRIWTALQGLQPQRPDGGGR